MQIWERCLFLSFQVSVSDEVVFAVSTIKIYWYILSISYIYSTIFIGLLFFFFLTCFFWKRCCLVVPILYLPQKLFLKFVKKQEKWKRTAQHTGKLSEQHGTVLRWIHIGDFSSLHFTIIYWLVHILCWHLLRYFSILFFFFMKFSQYTSTKKKFKKIKKSFIT